MSLGRVSSVVDHLKRVPSKRASTWAMSTRSTIDNATSFRESEGIDGVRSWHHVGVSTISTSPQANHEQVATCQASKGVSPGAPTAPGG